MLVLTLDGLTERVQLLVSLSKFIVSSSHHLCRVMVTLPELQAFEFSVRRVSDPRGRLRPAGGASAEGAASPPGVFQRSETQQLRVQVG